MITRIEQKEARIKELSEEIKKLSKEKKTLSNAVRVYKWREKQKESSDIM